MGGAYTLLPDILLRAPRYSFARYDPSCLAGVLADPVFRDALRLAAPTFYHLLAQKKFQCNAKEKHSLLKYYNRMCFRPVPFGGFASFSVLSSSNEGGITLAGESESLLYLLPERSVAKLMVMPGTPLRINPTLYRFGKEYRFTRSVPHEKGRYVFALNSLAAVPFYTRLLALLRQGDVSAGDLAESICGFADCTPAEAMAHLVFLAEEQVLYTPEQGQLVFTHAPNVQPELTNDTGRYYAVLERPVLSGSLSAHTKRDLVSALAVLQRLSLPTESTALASFTRAFRDRFDRQEVPLLSALDPDQGVAFAALADMPGSGLLDGLGFPPAAESNREAVFGAVHRLLFRLWHAPGRGRYEPIVLTDTDVQEVPAPRSLRYPPTTAMVFRETGAYLVAEQAGGASGTAVSGRFSLFSAAAYGLAKGLAGMEETANPDVVFADVTALTDLHIDNVSLRRQLYRYELTLNVRSGLPAAQRLEPADLLLSVRGDELVLRSTRLNKRVIPRLASALNYHHSRLPVFRFLCELQYQGLQSSFTFDPERFFPDLDFYPRFAYGRVVLSAARWRLSAADTDRLADAPDEVFMDRLFAWRSQRGIPRHVLLGRGDQQLVFDLGEMTEALFFRDCLPGMAGSFLQEYLLPSREVQADGKPLAAQYVAFFAQETPVYSGVQPIRSTAGVVRDWPPGGPWVCLQAYCTEGSANRLLTAILQPVLRKYKHYIYEWFFIRYRDPEPHLRIRIRAEAPFSGELLFAFRQSLQKHQGNLVRSYRQVAYQRELERYDPGLIAVVEGLFHAGSELVLAQIRRDSDDELGMALRVVCILLDCFFDGAAEQHHFAKAMAELFFDEFGGEKSLRHGLDTKYRALKPAIAAVWQVARFSPVEKRFRMKAQAVAQQCQKWPPERRQQLLADLIHMQINRTFSTEQRRHELLVYHCLVKWLLSVKARK